jgi:hypothetical protein
MWKSLRYAEGVAIREKSHGVAVDVSSPVAKSRVRYIELSTSDSAEREAAKVR